MFRVALLCLLLGLLPAGVRAGTYGESPPEGVARVEVLPGWREDDRQMAALRIRLAPGWKTYWRAPGDAGIPPELDWHASGNLAGVQFLWPTPEVFSLNGMRALGYHGELVLPMVLTPTQPGRPIAFRAELDMGVCLQVCVPVSLRIAADLPAGGRTDPAIRAALAEGAVPAAKAGVASATCRVDPIRDGLRVTAHLELPPQGGEEVVVIEPGVPGVWASEAESRRAGRVLTATADLVPPSAQPFTLDRSRLRITVIGGGRAVDITGCPAG